MRRIPEPVATPVRSQDLTLNVLTLGEPANPALMMLHGIRDVAMSLLPVAAALADSFYLVLPDLRGHGDSDKPGHYALPQFVYDLECVRSALGLERPAILGHSLGGHIAAHYAALFPEHVRALIIAEGLGPPERTQDRDDRARLAATRAQLMATMAIPRRGRPLPSLEFAAERLCDNNHRLAPDHARWLADHCTALDEGGNRYWKFDPRAAEIWLGGETERNRERWRHVRCPVLVVTGGLAHEYWRAQMPFPGFDGRFSEADLAGRLAVFDDVEHVHLANAGHMLHFDAPEELAASVRGFLG
jgi:pimeloyl-ACP methyl ester carboxylesterase